MQKYFQYCVEGNKERRNPVQNTILLLEMQLIPLRVFCRESGGGELEEVLLCKTLLKWKPLGDFFYEYRFLILQYLISESHSQELSFANHDIQLLAESLTSQRNCK